MRICFVGDSFVNGTGDPDYLGWTGRICRVARKKGIDITYYNLGVRRNTSTDIAVRWLEEVSRRLPEGCNGKVVFSFGVNDTTIEEGKSRIKFEGSIENTYKILTDAQPLFPILMVSPPPVPDSEQNLRVAELSAQFKRICCQLNVPYLDVFHPLQASTVWLKEAAVNDGYHPGSAGYSEFARLVEDWSSWLSWIE
jgi:lysophospholipase L1-like esterase